MKILFLVVELILKVFIWFYMFSFIHVPARQVWEVDFMIFLMHLDCKL